MVLIYLMLILNYHNFITSEFFNLFSHTNIHEPSRLLLLLYSYIFYEFFNFIDMTAFEILLNKFYDTIEKNEPDTIPSKVQNKANELSQLIRKFIDTSFSHGEYLAYNNKLTELIENAGGLLQNTTHEEWSNVKYVFMENDLHIIRRDRDKVDVQNLKMRLDRIFFIETL